MWNLSFQREGGIIGDFFAEEYVKLIDLGYICDNTSLMNMGNKENRCSYRSRFEFHSTINNQVPIIL